MAGLIADAVFDAALNLVKSSANKAQVTKSSSGILINSITLTSANYGSAGDYSGSSGREITALVPKSVGSKSDMSSISVTTSGSSAAKVLLLKSSAMYITAEITGAPINLGASDKVNLGTFDIILKDPA